MKCPKCSHENREGARFCEECGEKLQSKCPKCGVELRPGARFCDECGTKVSETDTSVPKLEDMQAQLRSLEPVQSYLSSEDLTSVENRPVTALFADISGFTALSAANSSESIFQMVQVCFRRLGGIIKEYDGIISGYRGDGFLALFGVPMHENDAERSIHSAIAIRDEMARQNLKVTIGINTAMMTVGEIQSQLHSEYTAYGSDIILAARLQQNAEPGQILVGLGTYRLTRSAFDFDVTEPLQLKGYPQPVVAYSVKGAKPHPEKLRGIECLRARMIGREHEFSDLKDAADAWLKGQGQIVSVIGEAGIGKSRLVRELKDYLGNIKNPPPGPSQEGSLISPPLQPFQEGSSINPPPGPSQEGSSISPPLQPFQEGSSTSEIPLLGGDKGVGIVFEGRCISIGQPISYWPFIDILRTYFMFSEEDDTAAIARKVTDGITQLMPQAAEETLPLLGQLLSIRFGNELDDKLKFASPEQIRHQTLMRLRDIFQTLARQKPLMLILEDLHWADNLSIDLISLLMDELANNSLMLVCVYRPEKEHRVWQLGTQARRKCLDRYTEITLSPLSSRESRQLVTSLLKIENLPDTTKDIMLKKSEGNPFFIEEVIRSLIEQDVIYHEDDHWKARAEIASIDVPDTIQSVVLSRVDQLQAEAKYILQCASVIGRLFRYRLLEHLSRHEQDLDKYLEELENRELVYEERTVPELEYAFKHAFTQEATYHGILERRRRDFHLQVARGIERLYAERLDEYYEELAHHYSQSDDAEKAVEYLLKAGEKAKRNYDNDVAISCCQRALEIIEQKKIDKNEWKLEALRGLGEVYPAIGKIPESVMAFKDAIQLAKEMKLSARQMVRLYYWVADSLYWQSRYDDMIRYGEMGLELLGDDNKCLEAALMNSRIATGNSHKGNTEKSADYTRKNMGFIKSLPYCVELANSYIDIIVYLYSNVRDLKTAGEWSEEYEKIAKKHNDLDSVGVALLLQGIILNMQGNYKGAISSIRKGLEIHQDIEYIIQQAREHDNISKNLYILGDINEAKVHARNYMTIAEKSGNPHDIAQAHLGLGNIAICQNQWDIAISHYQKYLEGWQKIGNSLWANLMLARAYLKKGDFSHAIEIYSKTADNVITLNNEFGFATILAGLERAYAALNAPEKFLEFCNSFKERHADEVKFTHWYLVPAELSADYPSLAFYDDFDSDKLEPSWTWVDEFGDCAYKIDRGKGLEISAANGRGMFNVRQDAPRILREFSGDFALEVSISPASDEKPQIGGILVWKDKDNFLMLENGSREKREIFMSGYADKKWHIGGRGYLPGSGEIHLRLERSGNQFSGYCSTDGKSWMRCGKLEFSIDDPVQIGLHAIGMIDRTIYCGEYREGTATVFRNFRIWKK